MTGKSLGIAFVAFAICVASYAQRPYVPYKVMLQATISHRAGLATVRTASSQPLSMAVQAVAQEYGWVVDFEDPPYAGTDLSIHPSLKPGTRPYTVVAGGPFQSTYRETPDLSTSRTAEQGVLQKIVSDYNKSGNPGQFKVLALPDGNFDVVGIATRDNAGNLVPVKPLLDTLISIPSERRTFDETLRAIANALPARIMVFPPGSLGSVAGFVACAPGEETTVAVGGSDVPARNLLMKMIDRGKDGVALGWGLGYQPAGQSRTPGPGWLLSVYSAEPLVYPMPGQVSAVPLLKCP